MSNYLDQPPDGFFEDRLKSLQQYDLVSKFWKRIEQNLRAVLNNDEASQTMSMYFTGGSLCLDGEKALYILRVCGLGSVNPLNRPSKFNARVIMPDYITRLVQGIYLKEKGRTEYYSENAKFPDAVVPA